jgi:hypothetical protein
LVSPIIRLYHIDVMTLVAALALAPSVAFQAIPLPKYNLVDGESLSFKVKAKAEIQPYSYGGKLTLKFKAKEEGKLWMTEIVHQEMMEMNGESGPGANTMSIWEMNSALRPTLSGQGANVFGLQLMACLWLPSEEKEQTQVFGDMWQVATTATKVDTMIQVTSKVTEQVATHVIDRFLDAKTMKLVKAKCVTKNATGQIVYELLPTK